MKKFLLSLAAVIVGASAAFADANIVVADATGFTSNAVTEANGWTAGDFTFKTAKNGGTTAPTYNTKGKDYRLYAKGTLDITATQDMTKIEFTISAAGLKRLTGVTPSVGTIADITPVSPDDHEGDVTVVWTGSAKSVTFTVGDKADYGTDGNSKAGQFDFIKIDIIGGGTYNNSTVEPEEPNYTKATTVKSGEAFVFVAGGKYSQAFDKNYGYMSATDLPAGTTDSFFGEAGAAMTFKAVEGGYTITTSSNRVLGAKAGYNTFDTTDDSAENRVWTLSINGEGLATIVNVATGKTVAQDPQYGSFGCYDADALEGKNLPTLFKLTTSVPEPVTIDYANISEFTAAANTFDYARFTNPLTAVYQNGRYLYVEDNTGVLLIYGDLKNGEEAIKYANGDQIPAGATGKYQLYNDLPQLSSPQSDTFKPGVAGTPVAPLATEIADITTIMGNHYISLTGVKIEQVLNEDGTPKANNYTVSQGLDNILLFNQFNNPQYYDVVEVTTGDDMNLEAIVTCYKGSVQLYPVKVTKNSSISNITVDGDAPAEYFNLQGIRVDNPANGIFIRRQGSQTSKVYVK